MRKLFESSFEPANPQSTHFVDWHEGRGEYQDEIQISNKGLLVNLLMPYIKPIIGSFCVPRSGCSNLVRGGAALA